MAENLIKASLAAKQLEQAQLQVEDLNKPKNIWQRLRTVFGS